MRNNLLAKPNTYRHPQSGTNAPNVNDPTDPYLPPMGTVGSYRNFNSVGQPGYTGHVGEDLKNEETFYKQIPSSLAGQLVTNSREVGNPSSTQEMRESWEADRTAHMGQENENSIARMNALRSRLGMSPATGGQIDLITNQMVPSNLPTQDAATPITGSESAPTTLGANFARPQSDLSQDTPVAGLDASNIATGTPTQAQTQRRNSIYRKL